MISEVDIRDWNKINIPKARLALEEATPDAFQYPHVLKHRKYLEELIDTVAAIQKRQTEKLPALLRKP